MKKLLVLALLTCLMVSPGLAAKPLRSGVYLSAKAGVMRVNTKREDVKKNDAVFPFAIALGLRLRHFRVEAEYMFATAAKMKGYEQETNAFSAQVYYDIPFKSPIRPFFNAGIGRHNTRIKEGNFKDDRHGTAWNVGGGVTWNLSNAVNLDLGYRYFDIGDLKTRTGTVKTSHHFIYLGWRYVF